MARNVQRRKNQLRETAAWFTANNPTLDPGLFGIEEDTGKMKIGDGATAWTSLEYSDDSGVLVSVDNTLPRFDGTTGSLQTSSIVVDDSDNVSAIGTLGVTGIATLANVTDSTVSTDGGTIVSGGLGVAKRLFVGTDLDVAGATTLDGSVNVGNATTIELV